MSPSYRPIKPKSLLKILLKKDFYIARTKGSHVLLKSYANPGIRVTIPMHNKELKRGTLMSILKQARIDKI